MPCVQRSLVTAEDPVAQTEDPHLLGELRPPGAAQVVPAVPQGRGGAAGEQGALGQQPAQRRPDDQPSGQEQQAQPPAEGGQHDAGAQPAEPVTDRPRPDQR
jgi:hypothetical protein